MKNFLFFILILLPLGLFGQVKFNFPTDDRDFGTVPEGDTLRYTFEFTNDGKDTILFMEDTRDVRPGCGCTAAEYTKSAILPGQKGFIKAEFKTVGRLGSFNKQITVSQKGTPYKTLTIKGYVVKKEVYPKTVSQTQKTSSKSKTSKEPTLVLNKKSHHFSGAEKNKDLSVRFELKNTGKDTLKILSSYSSCNCLNYKILNSKDLTVANNVLPGKVAHLEVIYKPQTPIGLSDMKTVDILTLFTNDPKNQKIELTLTSELK